MDDNNAEKFSTGGEAEVSLQLLLSSWCGNKNWTSALIKLQPWEKKTVSLSFLFWQLHNEAIFKKLLGEDEECVGCRCEEKKKNLVLQKSLEKPHLIKTLSFATTTKKTTTPCDKKHFSSCSATSYSSTATYKLQTQGNLQGGWCIQYTRNVCVCVCKMTPDLISWENKVVKLTLF